MPLLAVTCVTSARAFLAPVNQRIVLKLRVVGQFSWWCYEICFGEGCTVIYSLFCGYFGVQGISVTKSEYIATNDFYVGSVVIVWGYFSPQQHFATHIFLQTNVNITRKWFPQNRATAHTARTKLLLAETAGTCQNKSKIPPLTFYRFQFIRYYQHKCYHQ